MNKTKNKYYFIRRGKISFSQYLHVYKTRCLPAVIWLIAPVIFKRQNQAVAQMTQSELQIAWCKLERMQFKYFS